MSDDFPQAGQRNLIARLATFEIDSRLVSIGGDLGLEYCWRVSVALQPDWPMHLTQS